MSLIPPPNEATDIFSLSDQALSERYQFVEEIGFGNWGSVWLCRPKDANGQPVDEAVAQAHGSVGKVAVKLVHRSKTPTTAARVRSLWNEMKIVRSLKNDPHPSIIPFYNFIITPSYALISMAYLPTLVPVEVPELRAKSWFLSLISGVAFLHARGVVHNDIKPANILLTASDPPVPVLVDFGFAEKYDPRSSKAFLSNLAYGTPEYLSPERARGLPHDTRKSDVWSLGVTMFEILRGRTPFEHVEPDGTTETFSSKAELEKYWARTVKGKWVGKWSMSKGLERLLRKMILPNADLRVTAPMALNDPYFDPDKPDTPAHQSRSSLSLRTPSEVEASRLIEVSPPWGDRSADPSGLSPPASLLKTVAAAAQRRTNNFGKDNVGNYSRSTITTQSVSGKENHHLRQDGQNQTHQRTRSGKVFVQPSKLPALIQPFKQGTRKAPSFHGDTSNNGPSPPTTTTAPRRAVSGVLSPSFTSRRNNTANANSSLVTDPNRISVITTSSLASKENSVPSSRAGNKRIPSRKPVPAAFAAVHKSKAVEPLTPEESEDKRKRGRILVDLTKTQGNAPPPTVEITDVSMNDTGVRTPLSPVVEASSPLLPNDNNFRKPKESTGLAAIKQSIKQSLDKSVRFYKSSSLANSSNLLRKQSSGGLSAIAPELRRKHDSVRTSQSQSAESIEADCSSGLRIAKSSLPAVQSALRNEQAATENRLDRMTIWIRNVEKVVEEARASFAAGSMTPLPPLPARKASLGRRAPLADEIFKDGVEAVPEEPSTHSPTPRQRRITLVSASPETDRMDVGVVIEESSSMKDKEKREAKAQSVFDIGRPITPLDKLQFDISSPETPRSPTRLSAILDPNAFFNPKPESEDVIPVNAFASAERLRAVLTPVDPEPPLSTPFTHSMDPADYERILLASSGVKRNGKGYESNITTTNAVNPSASSLKRHPKLFHSVRRGAMPPPETPRKSVSVDELGALSAAQAAQKDDGNNTIRFMRRAFKAITGGTVSRRLSKAAL